jgi:hypothetical protein
MIIQSLLLLILIIVIIGITFNAVQTVQDNSWAPKNSYLDQQFDVFPLERIVKDIYDKRNPWYGTVNWNKNHPPFDSYDVDLRVIQRE